MPYVSILGYPWRSHQMPLLHSGAQRKRKDFSSDVSSSAVLMRDITLPALQKNFVNSFFVFAWEFCIEKWRGFLVNFFWSLSPTKRSTKSPRKIRGKFGANSGGNSGRKFEKFGKRSFCNFPDLTRYGCGCGWVLSGPLNRLNAILSLLQPLDRYRAPSAIGSAIGRPYLALSRFHAQVGALNRLVLNRFRGSTAR